jgi:hypothetical protein
MYSYTERTGLFVETLEALPDETKNRYIEHDDTYEEVCSICGCFGGLITIISKDIPGMKDVRKLRNHYPVDAERLLNIYLKCNFREWADTNPIIWDNSYGWYMFHSASAFGIGTHSKLSVNQVNIFPHMYRHVQYIYF